MGRTIGGKDGAMVWLEIAGMIFVLIVLGIFGLLALASLWIGE